MNPDPIQIRAGDLTAEHIGFSDRAGRTLRSVRVYVECQWDLRDTDITSEGRYGVDSLLTLSPPAPIRRRITWADLREHPPKEWDGANVVGTNYIAALTPHPHPRLIVDYVEHLITDDVPKWVVIEVPQGHALAQAGEHADG